MSNLNGTYVGGVNLITLTSVIQDLAPSCRECSRRITHFCMEACCTDQPLFCKDCETELHFLHRTNDLKALLIDKKHYTTEQSLFESFESIVTLLWEQKQTAQEMMEYSSRLYEICDKNLRQAESLRVRFMADCWHDQLYSTVEAYLKRESSMRQTSETFQRLLSRMKLSTPDRLVLTDLTEIDRVNKLIGSLVGKMLVEEVKVRLVSFNGQQDKDFKSFAQKLSLESFLTKGPGKSLLFLKDQYRSARMKRSEIGDYLAFDGSRLVIERQKDQDTPISWYSLPFLKELHTQVEFDDFPKVKQLELCMRFPPNLDTVRKIPPSVQVLRLYLEFSKASLPLTLIEIGELVEVLVKMPQVKELSLSVHNIDNDSYIKLIRYAIRNNMRGLQVCMSEQRTAWKYNFARGLWQMYFDEQTLRAFAKIFQSATAQISAIEKRRYIRQMQRASKERIITACFNELSSEILE